MAITRQPNWLRQKGCELVALAATLEGMFSTKGIFSVSVVVIL